MAFGPMDKLGATMLENSATIGSLRDDAAVSVPDLPSTSSALGGMNAVEALRTDISSRFPHLKHNALRLIAADRGRVFKFWFSLSPGEQEALLKQISFLDLDLVETNLAALKNPDLLKSRTAGELSPPTILTPESDPDFDEALRLGEEVLSQGWLALVEGAGGTGSRFFKASGEHPKGLFHISPSERYSFFEVRIGHLMALRRRYGRPIPYIVMVSDATREDTTSYFEANDYFGLREEIRIVQQRSLPYLEEVSPGKYDLVLESQGRVAVGGYGHADFTKHVLLQPDVVEWLRGFGTRYVQWLQIDNPLAVIGHRHLLGAHRLAEPSLNPNAIAMSFISLKKEVANEAAGILVRRGGGLAVWEYSDMDTLSQYLLQNDAGEPLLAVSRHGAGPTGIGPGPVLIPPQERKPDEPLLGLPDLPEALAEGISYRWGAINPNLVVVTLDSVLAHRQDNAPLVAKKSARHINLDGSKGDLGKKFIKFEAFLFDGLNDGVVVEEARGICFAPTKNAEGPVDSPISARRLMMEHAAQRLERLGWEVSLEAGAVLELDGLLELDDEALAARVGRGGRIDAGGTLSMFGLEAQLGDGVHITPTGKLFIKSGLGDATQSLSAPCRLTLPAGMVVKGLREYTVPERRGELL